MAKTSLFFKKASPKKINAGGPLPEAQIMAMKEDRYWFVFNTRFLKLCSIDESLCDRANAFKHALQTFGPKSPNLPDLRNNTGKAKHHIYHAHVNDSNGITYVIEWAIIDEHRRIMALIGFDTHENYAFRQEPLTQTEKNTILSDPQNRSVFEHATRKIEEAKAKIDNMCNTPNQQGPARRNRTAFR